MPKRPRKERADERNGFDLAAIRVGIKPFRLHYFARLKSTSDHAAKLRRAGKLFAPSAVLCGEQTSGRGRGSNTWWSKRGSIAVTFVLPIHDHLPPQQLPLLAGLAVRDAVAEITDEQAIQLKWPNDLLFRSQKLAGLLCERLGNADFVGIGINVNVNPSAAPRALRDKITSLREIAGHDLDLGNALCAVASHLHRIIRRRREQPFAVFLREYEQHHALTGKKVTVFPGGEESAINGICDGIDSEGRLIVRQERIVNRVVAGNVLMDSPRGARRN